MSSEKKASGAMPIELVDRSRELMHQAYQALEQKLAASEAKLEEILSYIPKVPTQPYEKELAQKLAAAESEIETLKYRNAEYIKIMDKFPLSEKQDLEIKILELETKLAKVTAERDELKFMYEDICK